MPRTIIIELDERHFDSSLRLSPCRASEPECPSCHTKLGEPSAAEIVELLARRATAYGGEFVPGMRARLVEEPEPQHFTRVFRCSKCRREQTYKPASEDGGVTESEAISIGWRHAGVAWLCPFCSDNEKDLAKVQKG
jgi:hypothetical protein